MKPVLDRAKFMENIAKKWNIYTIALKDGFTYERKEIEAWFKRTGTISPMTGKQLTSDDLHPNQTVRSLIDDFLSKQKRG